MTITSLGAGSGLDAESIISALMAVEKKPLTVLQSQQQGIKTKLSSFGQLQSLYAELQSASRALASTLLWTQTTASSSDTATVGVSTSSNAAAGSYSVATGVLALGQTTTSRALPGASSTLGSGRLTIELGSWVGDPATGFAPKAGATPVTIDIGAGETSLAQIRDKINGANAGVTASIINDASGARLALVSRTTGAENAFRVTASEADDDGDPAAGLSALTYDPVGGASQMTLSQAARNATATINGIEISSPTNTLADVAEGLSITLVKAASSANVTIAPDTGAVKGAIDAFVKAFNALSGTIKSQTKYDAATKVAGTLQGDRTALALRNQLREILNQPSSASSVYSRLSDIGIVMKADGTLESKADKLKSALGNLPELRKLLAADGATGDASGFMVRYRQHASAVLGSDGALTTVSSSLNSRIAAIDKRAQALNDRLGNTETRLRQQYQALDTRMSQLTGLSSYVNAQVSALVKTSA